LVVVAFITSLFLGIFIAFFLNYLENGKERQRLLARTDVSMKRRGELTMKKTWVFLLLLIFLWSTGALARTRLNRCNLPQAAQPSQPTLTIKSLTPAQGAALQNLTLPSKMPSKRK
jgi:hypothetical protein